MPTTHVKALTIFESALIRNSVLIINETNRISPIRSERLSLTKEGRNKKATSAVRNNGYLKSSLSVNFDIIFFLSI
jgi:hypothetical protein